MLIHTMGKEIGTTASYSAAGSFVTYLIDAGQSDPDKIQKYKELLRQNVPEATINEDEIQTITEELTSSEFEGRLAGREGGEKAEDYVNNYFEDINNLQKHAETGENYKQQLSHWLYYPNGPSKLEITDTEGNIKEEFSPLDEFIPLTSLIDIELNGETEPTSLHLYEGTIKDDFAGDIVLVPEDTSENQALNVEKKMVSLRHKANYDLDNIVKESKEKEVAGIIIEDSSKYLSKTVVIEPHADDITELKDDNNPILFKANQSTFQSLEDIIDNNDRLVNMEIDYNLMEGDATSNNIIGYIEGETDENLLIGAHTDHAGFAYNEEDDKEYYVGALDNASGTAVLMQLAKYAAKELGKPDKNIIFIGFGGEEIDLKGSFYYAHHPLFDLDKTSVINMDMIGEPFEIYNAESADVPMIEKLNRVLSIGYGIETNQSGKSYPSDNRAFEYISDEKGEINKKKYYCNWNPRYSRNYPYQTGYT